MTKATADEPHQHCTMCLAVLRRVLDGSISYIMVENHLRWHEIQTERERQQRHARDRAELDDLLAKVGGQ